MEEPVHFQHFEVLRREDGSLFELGRGAMGITYKAFDTNLRCHVALKVINSAYLNSDVARQRFLREARAAAALRHQNVATVFHLGSEGDNYFYAMEFVDGETVEAMMKRDGPVPAPLALEIVAQAARALGAAEKQGLVHRDIKPSNLMLIREDEREFVVKVIDFGLAKNSSREAGDEDTATLTAGGFLGTPHFASPEQLDERPLDTRSDIYSLGVTLWFMLAGKTPFAGSLAQVMSQHLHREPPFESMDAQPREVVALLRRMMAKAPADRQESAAALRREVEACRDQIRSNSGSSHAQPPPSVDAFETAILPEGFAAGQSALETGAILAGRFQLLEEVTASDHGRRFRAKSLDDNAIVEILILHSHIAATSEALTRLESEIENLQRLKSPTFQKILSLERTEYHSFLALEWTDGPVLLDLLRTRQSLTLHETIRLCEPLAQGFDELAAAGLSCPDIAVHEIFLSGARTENSVTDWPVCAPKFLPLAPPSSPTVSPDATLVATSFAMLRATGAFAANPGAACVFAVASLAYEMLGGARAGSGSGGPVPIPGLSADGNAILRRGMAPAGGFATSREFVAALAGTKSSQPARVSTPPATPQISPNLTPPQPPPRRGRPLALLAASAALFLVVAIAGVWLGSRSRSTPPAEPSSAPAATPAPLAEVSPTPPQDPFAEAMAAAAEIERRDVPAATLQTYAKIVEAHPDKADAPRAAMEKIAAGLRSRRLSPSELASLRQPLEEAAALNVVSAQMMLGEILRRTDPSDALKWFIAAGNAGQTEGMGNAGQMLASGSVETPDLPGAVAWFQRAADRGDPTGKLFLGECLLLGKGVPKDPIRAIELLTAASEFGEPRAMDLLAGIYRKGVPGLVLPNSAESLRLYSRAAELGNLDSLGNLGVLYINGEGVPKDQVKAANLFREGADKGSPLCMYFYAMCLEGGVGVTANRPSAVDWYLRAAKAGNASAADWCRRNSVTVTP